MKTFVSEINEITREKPKLNLEAWHEIQGCKIKLTVDFDEKKISTAQGITDAEITSLFWYAGLLDIQETKGEDSTVPDEKLLNFLTAESTRQKALALDTNLILSRFIHGFCRKHFQNIF